VFGYFWSLLDPLAMMLVYIILVSIIFKKAGPEFPLLVLIGILSWQWFSFSISGCVHAITSKTTIILSVKFPLAILPLATIGTHLCRFLLASLILIPFFCYYEASVSLNYLWWPILVLVQLIFMLGLGLIVSVLGVYFKDIQNIVPFVLRIWFYASPILYSVNEHIPENYRDIYYIVNPLAGIITSYKNILVYGTAPVEYVVTALAIGVTFTYVAFYIFYRHEKEQPKLQKQI
jgi:ABC-type polysaccharide/polyol phosphate export permease